MIFLFFFVIIFTYLQLLSNVSRDLQSMKPPPILFTDEHSTKFLHAIWLVSDFDAQSCAPQQKYCKYYGHSQALHLFPLSYLYLSKKIINRVCDFCKCSNIVILDLNWQNYFEKKNWLCRLFKVFLRRLGTVVSICPLPFFISRAVWWYSKNKWDFIAKWLTIRQYNFKGDSFL